MKCQRYLRGDGQGCGRNAWQTVDGLHLCMYHSGKRPLEIVLEETQKMRRHLPFEEASPNQRCEYHRGCSITAVYAVDRKNYCLKHAEKRVYQEALLGKLRGVITMAHERYDSEDEEGE